MGWWTLYTALRMVGGRRSGFMLSYGMGNGYGKSLGGFTCNIMNE